MSQEVPSHIKMSLFDLHTAAKVSELALNTNFAWLAAVSRRAHALLLPFIISTELLIPIAFKV